jgi:hypothetical protein
MKIDYYSEFLCQFIEIPVSISNKVDSQYQSKKLAVRHCIQLIVTNLLIHQTVAFSKDRSFYTENHTEYYTNTHFHNALQIVIQDGYAYISKKGYRNLQHKKGISSRVTATAKLAQDFGTAQFAIDVTELPLLEYDCHPIKNQKDLRRVIALVSKRSNTSSQNSQNFSVTQSNTLLTLILVIIPLSLHTLLHPTLPYFLHLLSHLNLPTLLLPPPQPPLPLSLCP